MTDEGEDDEFPLVLRRTEGMPIVPVHLVVANSTQIVPAILRPDLATTRIAAVWAAGLELSQGAVALAQLATDYAEGAQLWGPCEMITPTVDPDLDEHLQEEGSGGLLLGQDLTQHLWVTLLGPSGLIVIMRPPGAE